MSQQLTRLPGEAFTLIEMLVVVIIISILAGSAAVGLRGRSGARKLRCSADDLAAAIRFAAGQARTRRLTHRLSWSDDLRSFRVEASGAAGGQFAPVAGQAGRIRRLGEGAKIVGVVHDEGCVGAAAAPLLFGPGGEGFFGSISLVGADGQTINIKVTFATQQVHILE